MSKYESIALAVMVVAICAMFAAFAFSSNDAPCRGQSPVSVTQNRDGSTTAVCR